MRPDVRGEEPAPRAVAGVDAGCLRARDQQPDAERSVWAPAPGLWRGGGGTAKCKLRFNGTEVPPTKLEKSAMKWTMKLKTKTKKRGKNGLNSRNCRRWNWVLTSEVKPPVSFPPGSGGDQRGQSALLKSFFFVTRIFAGGGE